MAITAKFAADFASFVTAVDQADAKLADFQSGAGRVETALNKMVDAVSGRKFIQDATLMAEAVERTGGVARLSAAQLAEYGAKAQEAGDRLRAMGANVPESIQKVADAAKTSTGFFSDLTTQVKATALGFISAQAIIGSVQTSFRELSAFVGGSIAAYADAELAARKMTTALQTQGTATPAVVKQFNDLATQFQRTTVFSDDLINKMEALLTQIGNVAPSKMGIALKAATNLASGLGIDLESATTLVAKAFAGHTETLGKHGIVLDEVRVKSEGMEYVLGQIQARFGGQAQAEVETYSGKIKQLGNDWNNFQEAVGKSIVDDPLIVAALRSAQAGLTGVGDGAAGAIPGITAFYAELSGGSTLRNAAGLLGAITSDFQKLNGEIAKIKPPDPKAFTDFGNDFKSLNAEAKQLVTDMVDGWKREDESAERTLAKEAREIKERNKIFAEAQAEFEKLVAQGNEIRLKQGGTARQQEIADIKAQEAAEIESLSRRNIATTYNVALVHEKYKAMLDGLGTDWKTLESISQATANQQRDDALATYNYMTEHADQFTKGALDAQLQKFRDLSTAATAMGRAGVEAEDSMAAAAARHNDELKKQQAIADALAEQERIKRGVYTIGPDGKAVAVNQLTNDIVGKVTPLSEGESRDAAALQREINQLTKSLAEYTPKTYQSGASLASFVDAERATIAAAQQHANDEKQLEYLKTLIALLQQGGSTGGGGGTGANRTVPFSGPTGGLGSGSGNGSDFTEFDQLNAKQAALYLANGRVVDAQQQAIIDQMSLVNARPGYGFGPNAQGWININVNISGVWDAATGRQASVMIGDAIMTKLKIGRQLGAN